MKHPIAAGLLAMALSMAAAGAAAQEAYTATSVHLRAGPGLDYPVVAILPAGMQIWVQGCVSDYSWCDVVVGADRGWVYAGNIQSYYDGSSGYVPLWPYGAWFGIAVYPFVINDYWGRYYYNRPWYPQLHRWADHRPPAANPSAAAVAPAGEARVCGALTPAARAGPRATAARYAAGRRVCAWQPHGPGAGPRQPGAPIGVPRQPHATGGVPSVVARPSGRPAPAPGVAPTRPPSGRVGARLARIPRQVKAPAQHEGPGRA